jgi:hypothetical protein
MPPVPPFALPPNFFPRDSTSKCWRCIRGDAWSKKTGLCRDCVEELRDPDFELKWRSYDRPTDIPEDA